MFDGVLTNKSDSTGVEVESRRNLQNESSQNVDVDSSGKEDEGDTDDLMNYLLARDRSRRNIVPPSRFGNADMI